MESLLIILVCLFVALFIIVKLTEKHGKPLEPEQQSKLSRIFMILLVVFVVARAIEYFVAG